MKSIFYILIALFMTASFTSCTADNVSATEDITFETDDQIGGGDGRHWGDQGGG